MEMRLQKYLAEAGVASRRKSEEYITQGRVAVNGKTTMKLGIKVDPDQDEISFDGKVLSSKEKKIYIMLNKPKGFVTTVKDQFQRPTVMDLIRDISERVYPVGRLDYNTSGLLLLTNDGDFSYKITHPKHKLDKTYIVLTKEKPNSNGIQSLRRGIKIDEYRTSPAKVSILESNQRGTITRITIHEGRNRQVRKMFSKIGCPVLELNRVSIGTLQLEDLPEGKYRRLTKQEMQNILS